MLNGDFKKYGINLLKESVEEYNKAQQHVVEYSEKLFENRTKMSETILDSWELLNKIKNKPEDLKVEVKKIQINFERYENFIAEIERELKSSNIAQGGALGAGIAGGVGVAAFGPSAAMAIATTFGTASTGTAISTLSGAAATNAALAWLGGGTLAAGGAGTAGGSALLALAGPIGWGIGATALVTTGLLKRSSNKKIATKAIHQAEENEVQTKILKGTVEEISLLNTATIKNNKELNNYLKNITPMLESLNLDYQQIRLNTKLKTDLGVLINNTLSSIELLNKPIGKES